MNINCTNRCRHQKEGKCTLNCLPDDYHLYKINKKSDCPYINIEISELTDRSEDI